MSNIQLKLEKNVFSAGETLKGVALLEANKPLKTRGVYMSIKGKEKARIKRDEGYRRTVTDSDEKVLLDEQILLFSAPSISDGFHECSFAYNLPKECPPSYNGRNAKVEYAIQAYMDMPMRIALKDRHIFRIVDLGPTEHQPKPVSFESEPSQPIQISVTLQDNWVVRGRPIQGTVSYFNKSEQMVRCIRAKLSCKENTFVKGETEYVDIAGHEIRIPVASRNASKFSAEFTFPVPANFPTSMSGHFFNVRAFLNIRLNIAWHKDVQCQQAVRIMPPIDH
ncbi:arrestin family protein [bacterium]|nr:arrestin family protein [bacterium]